MAWRGVVIANPARLSLDRHCCLVDAEEGQVRLAFEDIAYVVFDTPQASLTSALLARFAENNVLVVTCDARHHPNGALLPLQGHHRQTASLRLQMNLGEVVRKRIWQRLVQAKIGNQAAVVDMVRGKGTGKALNAMAARVASGDPDSIEARAARDYFQTMFDDFRRSDDDDLRNAMLNYAYALLRAGLARALAAQGFHSALGIHHDSAANAFNLADDLIEPWRPLADLHVVRLLATRLSDAGSDLSVADRRELARLLVADVRFAEEGKMQMVTGIEYQVDGLFAALESQDASRLPLPLPVD